MPRRPIGIQLLVAIVLTLAAVASPGPALAQFAASITAPVHLRAGPAIEYPSVVMLTPGMPVQVFGCEQNYGWCDVQVGPGRGWVAASYLQARGVGGPVIIAGGGVALGIPIVAFDLNTYWGTYYRTRPWYARRPYYTRYWQRYPHGVPPRPPRPPVHVRPPPPSRPMPPPRPPGSVHPRPPAAPPAPRPPPATRPPGGANPPPGGKPGGSKPGDRPPPGEGKPGNSPSGSGP